MELTNRDLEMTKEILPSPGTSWDDPLCQKDENNEVIHLANIQLEMLLSKYNQQFS